MALMPILHASMPGSIELEARAMATNLTEEIAAKVSLLPPERQREALSLIEQLAARPTPRVSPLPRAER
jgi:hypothetical protein